MIRIGAVEFLNARPLVLGLEHEDWCRVRYDVPSVCARLLHEQAIDLGLVPTIELLRGPQPYDVVAGPAIACRGAVASVAMFTRGPVSSIRTIALDSSSRASAALLQILCARHFHISPSFVEMPPDLPAMMQSADAALLIGDPALDAPWRTLGLEMVDLGQAWWEMTGLPFVFAVWAARPGVISPEHAERLRVVRDSGRSAIGRIVEAHAAGDVDRRARALHYLSEHIRYDLDEDARAGLARYLDLSIELGLVSAAGGSIARDGNRAIASLVR